MSPDDTIVAVSSAAGLSARGMIRLSGPQAFHLVHQIRDPLLAPLNRERELVAFRLGIGCPVLVLSFPAPHSYTGEDCVEIQLPGQPVLLERVVSELVVHGARRAEAGEFTARAFFNGRVSLTEAEGIAATISADSDAELRAARFMTDGRLGALARRLADELAGALALVEAGIDFTDQDDVVAIAPADLLRRINAIEAELSAVLSRATGMDALHAIPHVVLAGPPNAGKSTLFNALLGRPRAVVSAISGTTRDVLAEPMHLTNEPDSPEVMLHDVAGVDAGDDAMNLRMQQALAEAVARADLVLYLCPPGMPMGGSHFRGRPTVFVRSKADEQSEPERREDQRHGLLAIRTTQGIGLDELRGALALNLAARTTTLTADALALQPRHESAVRAANQQLQAARDRIAPRKDERSLADLELVAADLRLALDHLGELAGEMTPDDVLGRVFASFCVGK